MLEEIFLPVVIALISSGTVSSILIAWMKRRDRTLRLSKNANRQADGIVVITETLLDLVDALHEKGVINGQSEHIRRRLHGYLLECTEKGFYMKSDEGDKQ